MYANHKLTALDLALPVVWSQQESPKGTVRLQGAVWSPAGQVGVGSPALAADDNQLLEGDDSQREVADSQWKEDGGSQVWHPVLLLPLTWKD